MFNLQESQGRHILENHLILERILAHLPDIADVVQLSRVSQEVRAEIRRILPLEIRRLYLTRLGNANDEHVLEFFNKNLMIDDGYRERRSILDNGGVVTSLKPHGATTRYTSTFRHLTDVDLSGTNVTTFVVKLLLAASAGGTLPLQPTFDHPLRKDELWRSIRDSNDPGHRLYTDQGLHITRLSIRNCRNVKIPSLIAFLRKIIIHAAVPQRNKERSNNPQAIANAALAQPLGPNLQAMGGNLFAMPPQQNQQQQAPAVTAHIIPDALQQLGLLEEDMNALAGSLATTVEDLSLYGLPALPLRRLEVSGADGLRVGTDDEISVFRTLAALTTVAGILGVDLDMKFCQGQQCAHGIKEDSGSNQGVWSHEYKRPLPLLPGERILTTEDGRIFRMPKYCLPNNAPQIPGTNPHPPAQGGPQGLTLAAHHAFQQQALQNLNMLMAAGGQGPNPAQGLLGAGGNPGPGLLQIPNTNTPATVPAVPAQLPWRPTHRRAAVDTFHNMVSIQPPGTQRKISMSDEPRGVCNICGREMFLCDACNKVWVLYCGGCAAFPQEGEGDNDNGDDGNDGNDAPGGDDNQDSTGDSDGNSGDSGSGGSGGSGGPDGPDGPDSNNGSSAGNGGRGGSGSTNRPNSGSGNAGPSSGSSSSSSSRSGPSNSSAGPSTGPSSSSRPSGLKRPRHLSRTTSSSYFPAKRATIQEIRAQLRGQGRIVRF
ncbi:hypothetical protein BZA77DRAFT_60185 [Pyronema omphalodes]|nr:hypothetical protein BZA77DRAFT_60185 [Pyronema omphalodes]